MEGIRRIAVSLCLTLLLSGLFSLLIPKGGLEKVMKFALGIFFLSCLVLPFVEGDLDFSFSLSSENSSFSAETVEEGVEKSLIGIGEQRVEEEIEGILTEHRISFQKVEVKIHIDGEKNITISEIRITLPESGSSQQTDSLTGEEVANLVEREAGIRPEVR